MELAPALIFGVRVCGWATCGVLLYFWIRAYGKEIAAKKLSTKAVLIGLLGWAAVMLATWAIQYAIVWSLDSHP